MEEIKLLLKYSKILKNSALLPGSSGNISIRKGSFIYITPSGISKDELDEKKLSHIDINGNILNNIKPSSEFRMHIEIYRKRKDINAIIHAHPPFTLACMALNIKIDYSVTVEFMAVVGKPSKVKYIQPGTLELAKETAKAADKSNIIILEKHGIVALGKDISQARIIAEDTENLFKINYLIYSARK